jgi:aryl-alcohol dehydrogenase-like predicted oxidoreductase
MTDSTWRPTRREAIRAGIVAGVGLTVGTACRSTAVAETMRAAGRQDLILKPIPRTGEQLPVIGIGTNRFGVQTEAEIAPLREVLRELPRLGGKIVDTARGYGSSEEVIGQAVKQIGNRDELFLATKYSLGANFTGDPRAGLEQAFSRLQTDMIDLMMVHNLGGTERLLPLMFELKQAGRFRYVGISTSSDRQYNDLAAIMRSEPLDFIEIDYSLGNRTAADMMLPLAQERGIAVLINVPFGGRSATVLQELASRPLPDWAAEFDATSWAQVALKWIVSHPAVTATIPGTRSVTHLADNQAAGRGRLPDAAMRRRIEQFYDAS